VHYVCVQTVGVLSAAQEYDGCFFELYASSVSAAAAGLIVVVVVLLVVLLLLLLPSCLL